MNHKGLKFVFNPRANAASDGAALTRLPRVVHGANQGFRGIGRRRSDLAGRVSLSVTVNPHRIAPVGRQHSVADDHGKGEVYG